MHCCCRPGATRQRPGRATLGLAASNTCLQSGSPSRKPTCDGPQSRPAHRARPLRPHRRRQRRHRRASNRHSSSLRLTASAHPRFPCMFLFRLFLKVVGCAGELVGEGRRGGQRGAQRCVVHGKPAGGAVGRIVHKSTALRFFLCRLRAKPVFPLSHEFVREPEVNARRRFVP